MVKRMVCAGWFLVLSLGLAEPVAAITVQRDYLSHGVVNCNASRFADGVSLHRSAMGIRNVGSSAVFVTCDFDVSPNVPNMTPAVGIDQVVIALLNTSANDVNVSCTLASGILHVGTFISRTTVVQRNSGMAGILAWSATNDFGGEKIPAPAVVCLLPPSVEISYTWLRTFEEIGQ